MHVLVRLLKHVVFMENVWKKKGFTLDSLTVTQKHANNAKPLHTQKDHIKAHATILKMGGGAYSRGC